VQQKEIPVRFFIVNLIVVLGIGLVAAGCGDSDHDNVVNNNDPVPHTAFAVQTIPDGEVGETYSYQLRADGGQQPYVFSVVQGALPSGLYLSTSGLISGMPTAAGKYNLTFQVESTGITSVGQLSTAITVLP
jgi:hypothetical protein